MKTKEEYMEQILESAEAFGWSIGYKSDPITENLEYMILGPKQDVKDIIEILESKTKHTYDA